MISQGAQDSLVAQNDTGSITNKQPTLGKDGLLFGSIQRYSPGTGALDFSLVIGHPGLLTRDSRRLDCCESSVRALSWASPKGERGGDGFCRPTTSRRPATGSYP